MENTSDILIYQSDDGQTKVDVRIDGETVWGYRSNKLLNYSNGINPLYPSTLKTCLKKAN